MSCEVWIDLTAPDPHDSDDVAQAQRPHAILELINAGWTSGPVQEDSTSDELSEEAEDENAWEVLDVRVLTHLTEVTIGLAVDTDDPAIAADVGFSLAHHLAGTPTVFGWRLDSLRTGRLAAPLAPGVWLPPANQPQARFPVAVYLPRELTRLCSQYLLVAAARRLNNPNDRHQPQIDADDLVASATEHPWGQTLVSALGGLLVAAVRAEAAMGSQHPLLGRGGGDLTLAQALLDIIRKDHTNPSTGYDNDRMRGHVLVEQVMTDHNLPFDRVGDTLDPKADEYRSQEQLRSLLRAGIRTLATLGKATLEESRSPWLWLTSLDSDDIDSVVTDFAGRDYDSFEEADEQAEDELSTSAYAHLLVRVALLHPSLVTDELPGLNNTDVTAGSLHHVAAEALAGLGAAAIKSVTRTPATKPLATAAHALLPALEAIDADDDDGFDDLHAALDQLLPSSAKKPQQRRRARTVLGVIASAATAVGPDRSADIARSLLTAPDATASLIVNDLDDRAIRDSLRARLIAEAAALDPTAAGRVAADLPALHSNDPRDEPALRTQVTTWWEHAVNALRRRQAHLDLAHHECPEPGAALLTALSSSTAPDHLAPLTTMPTATAAVAVAQAISTLSIALHKPDFPFEILIVMS